MKKNVAVLGILTALALILSYLETLIPVPFGVPGMKLGLPNLVVLYALYTMGWKESLSINFVRIVVSGLLFGTFVSLMYSLAGGAVSFLVMLLLKKTGKFSLYGTSIGGSVAHNTAQVLTAAVLMETVGIIAYLPFLLVSAVLSGTVIGLLCGIIIKRLKGTAIND